VPRRRVWAGDRWTGRDFRHMVHRVDLLSGAARQQAQYFRELDFFAPSVKPVAASQLVFPRPAPAVTVPTVLYAVGLGRTEAHSVRPLVPATTFETFSKKTEECMAKCSTFGDLLLPYPHASIYTHRSSSLSKDRAPAPPALLVS